MKYSSERYVVKFVDPRSSSTQLFTAGDHFRLRQDAITRGLMLDLPSRVADLLRIASSVYFIDRIVKRQRQGGPSRWPRRLQCSIEVADAPFWTDKTVCALLADSLEFVSGDTWELEFAQDQQLRNVADYPLFDANTLFDSPPIVCLYSGGLDSAAGLAHRLSKQSDAAYMPVVVRHRTDITKNAISQINHLAREFRTKIRPLCVAMSMLTPKRLVLCEETSQRARGFLFVSVGGAVAAAVKASAVELYEAGIGAINAPLLASMEGSQATRSSHPTFLRKMTRLLSAVAGYPIAVALPFEFVTKGQVTCSLSSAELQGLARTTISCVSYPLRHRTQKACGLCAACLFRRVAMHAAGIKENSEVYQSDVLNPSLKVATGKLDYLKAFLNQIDSLSETDRNRLPTSILRHLHQTELVELGTSVTTYVDLYRQYREEWLAFIAKAKLNGCRWAQLIDLPQKAA